MKFLVEVSETGAGTVAEAREEILEAIDLDTGFIDIDVTVVEEPSDAELVVFNSLDQSFHCNRCGEIYKPNLPCTVEMFAAMGKSFANCHRQCRVAEGDAA